MKQAKHSRESYNPALASLVIRVGLATVFVYAAIDAFREPDAWISYIPSFGNKFIAAKTALDTISVFQIVLAAWLLTGRYLKYSAAITAALLIGIMVFNPHTFLITFRDIGLVAATVALVFLDE
jgi:uncharacterized membrane protein YphA (DoxX/SURF4 family)